MLIYFVKVHQIESMTYMGSCYNASIALERNKYKFIKDLLLLIAWGVLDEVRGSLFLSYVFFI